MTKGPPDTSGILCCEVCGKYGLRQDFSASGRFCGLSCVGVYTGRRNKGREFVRKIKTADGKIVKKKKKAKGKKVGMKEKPTGQLNVSVSSGSIVLSFELECIQQATFLFYSYYTEGDANIRGFSGRRSSVKPTLPLPAGY